MGQMQFMYGNDAGMPSLGTLGVGDLAAVLDAALVNGGTTQSVTSITRSGTTATATKTAHKLRDKQIVTISGAAQSDYNITTRISRIDADHFSFTVANSPTTPATGTILVKIAALGAIAGTPWGIAFTATNQRAYRAAVGLRHYLMVNDNSNTNTCIVRAFTAMTAVTTGTGPFPTVAQSVTNLKWVRPDPTTYPDQGPGSGVGAQVYNDSWVIIGDEKRFWLGITWGATGYRGWHFFGEAVSLKPADLYHTMIGGYANVDGSDTPSVPQFPLTQYTPPSQGSTAFFNDRAVACARKSDQTTASWISTLASGFFGTSGFNTSAAISLPPAGGTSSTITGVIELDVSYVIEYSASAGGAGYRRGVLPGIVSFWNSPDYLNNDGVVYTGLANFPDVLLIRGLMFDQIGGLGFWVGDWDTVPT